MPRAAPAPRKDRANLPIRSSAAILPSNRTPGRQPSGNGASAIAAATDPERRAAGTAEGRERPRSPKRSEPKATRSLPDRPRLPLAESAAEVGPQPQRTTQQRNDENDE